MIPVDIIGVIFSYLAPKEALKLSFFLGYKDIYKEQALKFVYKMKFENVYIYSNHGGIMYRICFEKNRIIGRKVMGDSICKLPHDIGFHNEYDYCKYINKIYILNIDYFKKCEDITNMDPSNSPAFIYLCDYIEGMVFELKRILYIKDDILHILWKNENKIVYHQECIPKIPIVCFDTPHTVIAYDGCVYNLDTIILLPAYTLIG